MIYSPGDGEPGAFLEDPDAQWMDPRVPDGGTFAPSDDKCDAGGGVAT